MTKKHEVHKMMDHLKIEKFNTPVALNNVCFTFVYERNGSMSKLHLRKGQWFENATDLRNEANQERLFSQLHKKLVENCREKAKRKLIDIELANRGLFWCMYED